MTIVKLLLAITWAASLAAAQTQLSGMAQCPLKPTESYSLEVGDRPGHTYEISKGPCTWTKPMEIAGLKSKDQTGVWFSEIDGNKSQTHGSGVVSMDNGDKFYFRNQAASTMKDQKTGSGEATFTFTGGTGKLKGLKGKGTYKCTPEGDNVNCDVQGEYSLPSR